MAVKKDEKIRTPKQKAHHKQDLKKTKILQIGFGITLLIIVGLAGFGLFRQYILINKTPIAKVDDIVIDTRYFQDRTRLERNAYIQQYQIFSVQYQMFADDPSAAGYYNNQLLQFQNLLDAKEIFGELVLNKVISDQVIELEADELGFFVSEEEIDIGLQSIFSYYPGGTPTPLPTPTFYATPTYSQTQEAILGKAQPSENGDEQASAETTPEAIALPTDNTAGSESEEIQPSLTPDVVSIETPVPTATVYTKELFQQNYADYISDLDAIGIKEENLRKYMANFLLSQKVKQEVVKDVPHREEQIWARHILVKTKSEAIIALSRLDNGESWIDLAAELSLDTSNKNEGGDLGWFPRGLMVPEFENAAFELGIGEISDPIETDFGWHIIQLIGKDDLPLDEQSYYDAQEVYFNEWIAKAKENHTIEINEVWREIVPSEPSIPAALRVAP